jgi:HK97 gp10 family phage protein
MIKGMAELKVQLNAFEKRLVTNALRNTMMQAGTPILQAAKREAPKDNGALKKALRKRFWINKKEGRAGVIVSVSQTSKTANKAHPQEGKAAPNPRWFIPRNYFHLVIYGTAAHAISRGARMARKITRMVKGKLKTYSQRAKNQAGKMHPGAKPNPFLERALQSSKSAALAIIRDGMAQNIEKQIAKANAKAAKTAA